MQLKIVTPFTFWHFQICQPPGQVLYSWQRQYHNGQGKSLKSMGPPRPASASNKLMIIDIAASSPSAVPPGLVMSSKACSSMAVSSKFTESTVDPIMEKRLTSCSTVPL